MWRLGHPDRARERAERAVAHTRGTGHPFSLAWAIFQESVLQAYRRDLVAERERAAELIERVEAVAPSKSGQAKPSLRRTSHDRHGGSIP